MTRKYLLPALFFLPVLILLPHLAQFPFQTGASFSDLLVSHFPNGIYLQRALAQWKTVPLWSPAILSGYPFGADPLSGLYYPPGWLALLFPLPLGFNIVIALHLVWGGMGMYRLLRAEDLSRRAALLGALTFEALPKLFSHLGAGHITLIYAVTWTPWLLYAERRSLTRLARLPLPGILLGLIVLADVRWVAYSGLLWLAYSLYCRLAEQRLEDEQVGLRSASWWNAIRAWLPVLSINLIVAFLIATPLLLPLAQYTQLSTRSQLTPRENLVLSLPPAQLFGLAYPYIGGMAEWVLYPGAITFILAAYVLARAPARRRSGFWLVVVAVTLVFALGSYLPPLEWIARLPGMDLLRVPPRVLFLTGFAFAAVAGIGLDSLFIIIDGPKQSARDRSGLAVAGVAGFVVLFAAAAWVMVDKTQARVQFAWGAAFVLAGAVLILLARVRRLSVGLLTFLLLGGSLVDLSAVNALSLEFRSFDQVFSVGREAANYLAGREDPAFYRVYSPSYSLPQHVAAWYGLDLADGVDPLQLTAYAGYMQPATGVPSSGYSVTLPPFSNADPASDNENYVPDAEKLGLLNVKYLVSAFPLDEKGLVLLARFGQTRVYQNDLALPRAWVQPVDAPPGKEIQSMPLLAEWPNQVALQAQGPGLLVLCEVNYPGWQATVDGKPAPVETVAGLLRGVRIGAGEHQVKFMFRPFLVYAGLFLAVVTWAVLILLWIFRGRAFLLARKTSS